VVVVVGVVVAVVEGCMTVVVVIGVVEGGWVVAGVIVRVVEDVCKVAVGMVEDGVMSKGLDFSLG
jgi:hypothetical protein